MKAKPILMHGRSIRAILDGRKTQTRRIMNPQPCGGHPCDLIEVVWGDAAAKLSCQQPTDRAWAGFRDHRLRENETAGYYGCLKGQPGDLLYVRETWQVHGVYTDCAVVRYRANERNSWTEQHQRFPRERATNAKQLWDETRWRPSIHMPRWASRITLHLTDVRVERVQEISEDDAMAEGIQFEGDQPSPRDWFSKLWDDTNGAGAWERNDWVWCLSFEVIHKNVDEVIANPAQYGIEG